MSWSHILIKTTFSICVGHQESSYSLQISLMQNMYILILSEVLLYSYFSNWQDFSPVGHLESTDELIF
jgi:hypothetical protein